jgi:hypothetical protein
VTAPLPDTYQSELDGMLLEQKLSNSYPREQVHRTLGVPQTLEEFVKATARTGRLPGGQRIQVGGGWGWGVGGGGGLGWLLALLQAGRLSGPAGCPMACPPTAAPSWPPGHCPCAAHSYHLAGQ